MRASITAFFFLWALVGPNPAMAGLDLAVETKTFHSSATVSRVEVNMAFLAESLVHAANERGFMQARVEVLTIIELEGQVKAFGKTTVLGMERTDSSTTDLLHQEFFELGPGNYDLTVEARDLNSMDTTAVRYEAPLAVGAMPAGLSVSDLLFAERITPSEDPAVSKFGYAAVPLISDYFPATISKMNFYGEVYGSDVVFGKDSLYLVSYQIENFEDRKVFGPFKRSSREKGRPIVPVMAEFDISQLPSGNYLLAVEVRDRSGDLRARGEQFFQRNNPIAYDYDLESMDMLDLEGKFAGAFNNTDSLVEFVACLTPIADPLERKIINDRWKDRDPDLMKRFFYSFWANRSPRPEEAWREYKEKVDMVNRLYGCRVQKGYETDRGRVFLHYGAPNTQMDRLNEMDTSPYTIWHYYRAGKYTNRRFVFYQPDLISNCFQLLHSDVPGEIQNAQWNQILHSRSRAIKNVQAEPVNTYGGERANEFFEQPR